MHDLGNLVKLASNYQSRMLSGQQFGLGGQRLGGPILGAQRTPSLNYPSQRKRKGQRYAETMASESGRPPVVDSPDDYIDRTPDPAAKANMSDMVAKARAFSGANDATIADKQKR